MLTIGYVNPNKRIHSVIEALAQTPELAARATYVVLGAHPPPYYDQLQDLVRRHGLRNTVRFTDYAPEEMLHSYLHHADICLNLRYPATEGASGTLVEHSLAGKAMIVTDTAAYSDLPDDCVLKVLHAQEKQELPAALQRLASDEGLRASLGQKAREYSERFHPARYAEKFLRFASEVRRDKPLLQLADRLASELSRMGVHTGMAINGTVSTECESLFGDTAHNAGELQ
jgi:glycosyltransferase involved in cell wall biosynthesis